MTMRSSTSDETCGGDTDVQLLIYYIIFINMLRPPPRTPGTSYGDNFFHTAITSENKYSSSGSDRI